MALQSSGAISLDEICIEAGGTTESTVSINDTDIRALISKASEAAMSFSEWYGASSGASSGPTSIHETSFKPKLTSTEVPPINKVFKASSGSGSNITDSTFPNSGTFSDGTTTYSANGLTITQFSAFETHNLQGAGSSSDGPDSIDLFMKKSSGSGNPANGGWTKIEAYANTSGTGTPLISLNRTDATFTSSVGGSNLAKWSWAAPSGASFSTFFGTNTSAPSSPTHLIRIT